ATSGDNAFALRPFEGAVPTEEQLAHQTFEQVQSHRTMVRTRANARANRRVCRWWFEPGEWVTMRPRPIPTNLAALFARRRGPFRVVARHGTTYLLAWHDGIPLPAPVPGDTLMPYSMDEDTALEDLPLAVVGDLEGDSVGLPRLASPSDHGSPGGGGIGFGGSPDWPSTDSSSSPDSGGANGEAPLPSTPAQAAPADTATRSSAARLVGPPAPYSELSEDSVPESFLQLVLKHGGSTSGHAWRQPPPEDRDYAPQSTDSSGYGSDSSGYHTPDGGAAGPSGQPFAWAQHPTRPTAAPLPEDEESASEQGRHTGERDSDANAGEVPSSPNSA
ncbi:hypothetical protein LPJ61_005182, partial [Coemansia biformis]